ncbi:uncharacterized protein LOC115878739 isoform X2 [Sitophilus oryzae]|uniref:Uncharacterized protein LOC115878739 isoform X2 n=1 Tax=Sitophilus oryzae TaxID=7048 RepID=A0A6J2XKK8_SITOR|nr:uncharacterized protein LOC115878739 isoform X2 [Sitophilus oryzae]
MVTPEKCLWFSLFLLLSWIAIACFGFPIDEDTMVLPPRHYQGEIDALVFEEFPKRTVTRLHRAARVKNSRSRSKCVQEHVSWKAFNAPIVLRAKAQSFQGTRSKKKSYKVQFTVKEVYKNASYPIHDIVMVKFANLTGDCRKDNKKRGKLVKANIRVHGEYFLFLNFAGDRKLMAVSQPESAEGRNVKGIRRVIQKVCATNFEPKPLSIEKLEIKSPRKNSTRRERIKLACRVRGLPIHRISWRRNDSYVSNSTTVRIKYLKTSSVLTIRSPKRSDYGSYECVAQSLNGTTVSRRVDVLREAAQQEAQAPARIYPPQISSRKCPDEQANFCMNGGKCYVEPDGYMLYCKCPVGFQGWRCDMKDVRPDTSMYPQPPIYTCTLGLSTKYYC